MQENKRKMEEEKGGERLTQWRHCRWRCWFFFSTGWPCPEELLQRPAVSLLFVAVFASQPLFLSLPLFFLLPAGIVAVVSVNNVLLSLPWLCC
jgi:hypothetical protein